MAMQKAVIGDKEYTLVVLRVLEKDGKGRPSRALVGYDDTTFRLDDPALPNEFVTAWVPSECVRATPPN